MTARQPRRARLSFAALASPVVLTVSLGGCGDKGGTTEGVPNVCNAVCEPVTSTYGSSSGPWSPTSDEPPTSTFPDETTTTTTDTTTTSTGTTTEDTSASTSTTTTTDTTSEDTSTSTSTTTETGGETGETSESTGP